MGKFANFEIDDLCDFDRAQKLNSKYYGRFGPAIDYALLGLVKRHRLYSILADDDKEYSFNLPRYLIDDQSGIGNDVKNGIQKVLDEIYASGFSLDANNFAIEYTDIVITRKHPNAQVNAIVVLHIVDDLMEAIKTRDPYRMFDGLYMLKTIQHVDGGKYEATVRGMIGAREKNKKAGTHEVKAMVLECLIENGSQYKNKTAFIKDMLEKFGDKITSTKTIERYLADSSHTIPHWRTRKKMN